MLLLLSHALVTAQPVSDVQRAEIERLHRTGQTVQALAQVDAALAALPADPSLRFLKAVMLSDAGRTAEASDLYLRLTQEFPELPEPYNNLAVLHAAEGRLEEARSALETALRNNPSYLTAQENLGDVYVRLAARAYERADARAPSVQRKLQQVRQVMAAPRS